jgi:hypothetical protein
MQTIAMGYFIRPSSYFVTAFWAGLAAPTGLYAAPNAYPCFVSAGSVERGFVEAASYISTAWGQYNAEYRPAKPAPE